VTIWTSLAAETALISTLQATGRLATTQIGTSAGGLPILLWRIGGDVSGPPEMTSRAVLLHVGLQHGDEPAGREALLAYAEDLCATVDAGETGFLDTHGVLLIPTANPDGLDSSRTNADGQDPNRFHLTLQAPESAAVASVLAAAQPLLVIDHHEFGTGFAPEDVLFAEPRHPAAAGAAVTQSTAVIDVFESRAATDALSFADYPDTGAGQTQAQRLVANCGLRNSAAVLIETRESADDDAGQQARVDIHSAMCEEALAYAIANSAALLTSASTAAADRTAAGVAGATPFQLGGGATLDPPPLAYELTIGQLASTTVHRVAFGIGVADGTVLMGQAAQPVIPLLVDGAAETSVVSATPVFDLDSPPSSGGGSPTPVAQARIRNRVTWLGCRLGDGRIIAELPDITGAVSRVIGRYTSASLSIPIPLAGPAAVPLVTVLQATAPTRTMVVAVVNDVPTWAGIPLPRTRGTPATMPLGCVSIEGYLQHRFVGDHVWNNADESSVIAAGLLGDAGALAGVGSGIGLIVDAPPTGRSRDRTYLATDHRNVYDALSELMAVRNGPEWTIDLDWTDGTHTAVALIARVRSRLGIAATSPQAIFETTADSVFASQGGADATYELAEDNSGDRYANFVVAYGSGEGEDQPQSDPAIDHDVLDTGAPIWEQHYRPSTSITSVSVLDEHAEAQLARVHGGAQLLTITSRLAAYPRYGVDWQLGDDIGWQLAGHGHPQGFTGQGRAVGFELDAQAGTIRPLLQEED
jgi:hypothetical protein